MILLEAKNLNLKVEYLGGDVLRICTHSGGVNCA